MHKEGVIREGPHGTKVESSRFSDFDPKDWEGGRYASIAWSAADAATRRSWTSGRA